MRAQIDAAQRGLGERQTSRARARRQQELGVGDSLAVGGDDGPSLTFDGGDVRREAQVDAGFLEAGSFGNRGHPVARRVERRPSTAVGARRAGAAPRRSA